MAPKHWGIYNFLRWQARGILGYLVYFPAFSSEIRGQDLQHLTWGLFVPAILIVVVGIGQLILGIVPQATTGYIPLPVRQVLGQVWFLGLLRDREATGSFYVSVTILLLSLLLLWNPPRRLKVILTSAFILSLWALGFTKARAYWFGYLIGVSFLEFYLMRLRGFRVAIVSGLLQVVVVVGVFALIPGDGMERLAFVPRMLLSKTVVIRQPDVPQHQGETTSAQLSSETAADRPIYWIGALQMFQQHPLFGIGLGQYSQYFSTMGLLQKLTVPVNYGIRVPPNNVIFVIAHNSYLQMLAEFGIVGFTLWMTFWIMLVIDLSGALRRLLPGSFEFAFILATLAIVGAQMAGALFDSSLWAPTALFPMLILCGLSSRLIRAAQGSGASTRSGNDGGR